MSKTTRHARRREPISIERMLLTYGLAVAGLFWTLAIVHGIGGPAVQAFEAFLWSDWRGVVLAVVLASGLVALTAGVVQRRAVAVSATT
jgi:hypothetical protein